MSGSRRRFCVFCGKQPEDKNNEHVIPRWLIEITGDPKRLIQIGPFINREEIFERFAFDQFRFPACSSCNYAYAEFESRSKSIMEKLLRLGSASAEDFDAILDWFDKVRVGLWLGYHQLLDKNFWGISPNYYISDRIGTTNRLLLIYRTEGARPRVNFAGIGLPAFALSPTCFTLIVNDLFFVNIATDFLLARRAGLPYPESVSVRDDNRLVFPVPLLSGTEQLEYPIMGYDYDRRCTIVAQPIFKKYLESTADAYAGGYIANMAIAPGKLRPLIQDQTQVKVFPREATLDWLPSNIHNPNKMLYISVVQTLRLQNEMLRRVRVWKDEEKAKKRLMKYRINQCVRTNAEFISWIKEEMMPSKI